jgi:hypothetical protein
MVSPSRFVRSARAACCPRTVKCGHTEPQAGDLRRLCRLLAYFSLAQTRTRGNSRKSRSRLTISGVQTSAGHGTRCDPRNRDRSPRGMASDRGHPTPGRPLVRLRAMGAVPPRSGPPDCTRLTAESQATSSCGFTETTRSPPVVNESKSKPSIVTTPRRSPGRYRTCAVKLMRR